MAKRKSAGGKPAKKAIESYTHDGQQRPNNPPVGLVTAATDPPELPKKTYAYDPHLDPQLVWAGKAEGTSFDVPIVSLHVHERIDPKTIIQAVRTNGNRSGNGHKPPAKNGGAGGGGKMRQRSMFEESRENPPLREAIDFYRHPHGWTNRLIAGDSLLVMNSLLEKEGMAGKVQMIYIDPPYGIRYGSNFQPFVNNRDVKDGKDEDLTQEPEMIRAFRDTWEAGVHSYLSWLRDRLLLASKLLHGSGSCFVQISDVNLHHVRELMDEVFGSNNFRALVSYRTSVPLASVGLAGICDYIVWYAKDAALTKFHDLYTEREVGEGTVYTSLELPNGVRRRMNAEERADQSLLPKGAKIYCTENLVSSGYTQTCIFDFEFDGHEYSPTSGKSWKTTRDGMKVLSRLRRIDASGRTLRYVLYYDDYPVMKLTNLWTDLKGESDKIYVVQTAQKAIQRCVLMTTDPSDLVLDPTCGSGTTAFVAEQWGRRWITCDTSRVAVVLAKQRLMTADFEYYKLANESEGVGGGFAYRSVPHITLGSITNNPEITPGMKRVDVDAAIERRADHVTLYDQPQIDKSKARVTGPFTVEAVPAVTVRPLEMVTESRPLRLDPQANLPGVGSPRPQAELAMAADVSVTRYGETARQRAWRDELHACGVRGKSGQRIEFARLEPLPGCRWLHAIGETGGRGQGSGVRTKKGFSGWWLVLGRSMRRWSNGKLSRLGRKRAS
jgi:adenine-specific DNA-methyltransferase